MKKFTYRDLEGNWRALSTIIIGTWLVIAPFVMPEVANDDAIVNNTWAIGVLLQTTGVALICYRNSWMEWPLVILSSWAIAVSYFYDNGVMFDGFNFSLASNLFIVGMIIMVLAGIGLFRRKAIRDMDRPSAA